MLHDRLRGAIEAVIALASKHGTGHDLPSEKYTVRWMNPVSDTRSEGRLEDRTEPCYYLLWQALEADLTTEPRFQELDRCAGEFVKTEGKFFPFFVPFGQARPGQALLQVYFSEVGTLKVDDAAIATVCTQFVEDLGAETGIVRAIFLVENFRSEAAFALAENIMFRPLTMDDIDRYGRTNLGELVMSPFNRPWLDLKDWICSVEGPVPKTSADGFNEFAMIVDDITVALNLTVPGRATFCLLEKSIKSPFLSFGRMGGGGTPAATSRAGESVSLSSDGMERFRRVYGQVRNTASYLQLPLRRLRASASRQEAEDHLVDCVIGLERLLAPDSEALETTFRFQLRGAALLPDRFGSAAERRELMKNLYRVRSKIVHGSATQSQVGEYCPKAEEVLREILLWYLHIGTTLGNAQAVAEKLDETLIAGATDRLDLRAEG